MSLARQLAERVTSMRYQDLPPEVIHWSKVAVLDTVGVALAGAGEDAPKRVEETLELRPGGGPSLIIGSNRRAGALDATLVNGVAAHALDFDNTAKNLGGHVSAVMVPALIAAGEAYGASGRDLILAHAAGYEVGASHRAGAQPPAFREGMASHRHARRVRGDRGLREAAQAVGRAHRNRACARHVARGGA